MPKIQPYSLRQAQRMVVDAWNHGESRRRRNRILNRLYRTGRVEDFLAESGMTPGQLERAIGVPLDAINLVLPHTNIIIASSVARDPRFLTSPWTGGDDAEAQAKIARVLVQHFWAKAAGTEALRSATKDMVIGGSGFLKVAWHRVEGQRPRAEHAVTADLTELIHADHTMTQAEGSDPTPMDELRSLIPMFEDVVEIDRPVIEWIDPDSIIVPPNARRMHTTRWVAQRLVLPLDEVKANPAYSHTADLVANMRLGENNEAFETAPRNGDLYEQAELDAPYEYIEIFEFYDMRAKKLLVLTRDGADALYDGDLPFEHRLPPFVHLRNYDDGQEFWPFGDLENVAAIMRYLGEAFTEQMENLRRAGNLYVGNRNYMDDETAKAIQNAEPDELVLFDAPQGIPLAEVVQAFPRQPMPNDVYAAKDHLEAALQQVMGISDFQAGGVGADRMSATAAAVVDGVASLRAQDKIMAVERGAEAAAALLLALIQEFCDEDTAVRVAGPNGVAWINASAEDIAGEFRVSVDYGSTKAVNPATKSQQGQQLIQLLPTIVQAGGDPVPPLRAALRDMGYDPDTILKITPPQPNAGKPLAETLNYKDAPEDIRRQIEQQAGLQPSAIGSTPAPTSADAVAAGGTAPKAGAGPAGMGGFPVPGPGPAAPPPGGDSAAVLDALRSGAANPGAPTASAQSLNLGGPPVPAQTEGEIAL